MEYQGDACTTWSVTIRPGHYSLHFQNNRVERADTRCGLGPIVRINSRELSIDDPDFLLDEVSTFKSKLDQYPGATKHFAMDDATVFTETHDLRRLRRGPLTSFFSRCTVSRLQDPIRDMVEKLCSRITESQGTDRPID